MTTAEKLYYHVQTIKDAPDGYQIELYVSKPDTSRDPRVLTVKEFKYIASLLGIR